MIEDGRAFGTVLVLKHILATLEGKGVITSADRSKLLDEARAELERIDPLTPEAKAEAARAIGYLRVK